MGKRSDVEFTLNWESVSLLTDDDESKAETAIAVSAFFCVLLRARNLINLYQIAAGIIVYRRGRHAHVRWLHCKLHAELLHAFILTLNIADLKGRERNSILHERFLECFHSGITRVGFEQQLRAIGLFR